MGGNGPSHPWYARRTAVRAEVDCAGGRHRVTWRRGRLVLEDHDLAAEQALHGLGGEKTACVEVLEEWRALNARAALEELPRLLWPARPRGETSAIPEALRVVAGLAAIVRCERHWDDADFPENARRVVATELNRCFESAVRSSLAFVRDGRANVRVRARTEMVAASEPASISVEVSPARREVRMAAALPITWLLEVWGRGIASVDGRVVVEAAEHTADRIAAAAIHWDGGTPHLATVWLVRSDEGWHAHPADPPPQLPNRPWWSVDRPT